MAALALLTGCGGDVKMADDAEVGDETRVCGSVAGVRYSKDDAFINLGRDYPDPDRFVIVVWDQDYYVSDDYKRPRACAEGVVTDFEGVRQIEVWDSRKVKVYDDADMPDQPDQPDDLGPYG